MRRLAPVPCATPGADDMRWADPMACADRMWGTRSTTCAAPIPCAAPVPWLSPIAPIPWSAPVPWPAPAACVATISWPTETPCAATIPATGRTLARAGAAPPNTPGAAHSQLAFARRAAGLLADAGAPPSTSTVQRGAFPFIDDLVRPASSIMKVARALSIMKFAAVGRSSDPAVAPVTAVRPEPPPSAQRRGCHPPPQSWRRSRGRVRGASRSASDFLRPMDVEEIQPSAERRPTSAQSRTTASRHCRQQRRREGHSASLPRRM